jgi:SAM-dependent methyltransferase
MSTLNELDEKLAQKYGAYASYRPDTEPVLVETHGDAPADEVDRLLNIFAQPRTIVLDLGCGAGQTLCRLAPLVNAIWGFDQDGELMEATRQRVATHGLNNATLIQGNVALPEEVNRLPNNTFDLVLSRRGPNINEALLPKLRPDAYLIQELADDPLGLKELFGRKPFLPESGYNPHWLIPPYRRLGLLPVSVKDYFYAQYFTDSDHLARYLGRGNTLSNWWMPSAPYDESRDRPALDLYARYNTTPKGIRIIGRRQVYLFRRAEIHFYPALPNARPLY